MNNIITLFWVLFLIGSQVYVFDSGLPQPAHFLFIFAFLLSFFSENLRFAVSREAIVPLRPLAIFSAYATLLNLLYFSYYYHSTFLVSTLHIIFGFCIFISFIFYLNGNGYRWPMMSLALGIVILFFLSVFDIGRFNFYPRFNAFFNDPNQMAFWAICAFSSVSFLTKPSVRNNLLLSILFIAVLYICIASISRSAFIALIPMGLGLVFKFKSSTNSPIFRLSLFLVGALLIFGVMLYASNTELGSSYLSRMQETNIDKEYEDRGYNRLSEHYEYLLVGAGQGYDMRFNSTHEIHSTWAAILFYYGVVGISIFLIFLFLIFRSLGVSEKLIFISPLMYGFSTYGARTPIFWIFISVAVYVAFLLRPKKK